MTKEVLVSVRGLQYVDNEIGQSVSDEELDQIETICPGEYFYRNDAHYVLYEERMDDIPEPIKNMIKIRDKEFSLWKKGPVNVQMVFSEGKKTMTDYFTPFGNILVAMDTREVCVTQDEDCIKIHIAYALEANYQFIADCSITIEIKSNM
ncbi:MAG: DUF1934 domain-containing protein [Lachnospiraceae bacterium]|nr:DUF1934 domain-containing protein [Lachnospiraceae bacterium]